MVIGGSVVGYRPVGYIGPGDIVSGADAWWGLRAYSFATAGSNAIRLRRNSDNAEQDFTTLANGNLDVDSISTFKGAADLFVVTLYDQTGNAVHITQATAASQPAFILSGLGSLPTITFDGTDDNLSHAASGSISTFTISAVANRTANINQQSLWFNNATFQVGYRNSADNQAFMYVGSVHAVTVTDGNWHGLQCVFNGASSVFNVDGTQNIGNPGSSAAETTTDQVGASGSTQRLTGSIVEIGRWTTLFSASNSSNMFANQQNYWGF